MTVLSLIIPTRNRERMLLSLLEACKLSVSNDLEFIIADNSDNPLEYRDLDLGPRFKIVRSESRISMTSNWELGLERASGDWRVFVGDDDGVIPRELDLLVDALKASRGEAVIARFAHFSWPKVSGDSGRVSIWLETGAGIRWTGLHGDPYRDFSNVHFPVPYARAVFSKSLQHRIRRLQSGQLFTATAPDFNLGAAISLASKRIQILSGITPFIVGASNLSNGAQGPLEETKKDFASLNSISWLPELGKESMATNYLSYLEPIAQARRAQGLRTQLPKNKRMIWNSLISTRFHREIVSHLSRSFPKEAAFTVIAAPFALLVKNPVRMAKLLKWAIFRVTLNGERYVSSSSRELLDTKVAALKLQSLIEARRSALRIGRRATFQDLEEFI